MSLNLATMLRESAVASAAEPVALYDGGRLSYGELDERLGEEVKAFV